jgi:anti-sigma B factor antagonist
VGVTLSIVTHREPDATMRLALDGEIDLASAKALREAIHAAARDRDIATVIVDLESVVFIDSTGIATLIDGRKFADVCTTTYRVVNPRDLVRRVLEITGVLSHLGATA